MDSAALRRQIASEAPITFARYMELCLYHPEHGYYASRTPGGAGDYVTAPTTSPLFGECMGRVLAEMRDALGAPEPFDVVEVGGGDASLATAAMATLGPRSATWTFVERHARIRDLQRAATEGLPVRWAERPPEDAHCVLANEVLDNFPVHLVRVTDGAVLEAYVTADLTLELAEPSTDTIAEWVTRHVPLDGDRWVEVPLDAVAWVGSLSASYVLLVDYGDESPDMYLRRPRGSVVAMAGHRPVDPLGEPGEADITAHVNFTAVGDALRGSGYEVEPLATQRDVLFAYGLRGELDVLRERSADATGAEALDLLAQRNAAALLVDRGGMGSFRVLLARRGPVLARWPRKT